MRDDSVLVPRRALVRVMEYLDAVRGSEEARELGRLVRHELLALPARRRCPASCPCLCHDTGGGAHDHPGRPCPAKGF